MRNVDDIVRWVKVGTLKENDPKIREALHEIDKTAVALNLTPKWEPIRAVIVAGLSAAPMIIGVLEIVQALQG